MANRLQSVTLQNPNIKLANLKWQTNYILVTLQNPNSKSIGKPTNLKQQIDYAKISNFYNNSNLPYKQMANRFPESQQQLGYSLSGPTGGGGRGSKGEIV